MFYKKFIELCNKNEVTPTYVGAQIGVSKAAVSGWKTGSVPRDTQLAKIADYFGVPVEYFSEETEKPPVPKAGTEDFARLVDVLTPERRERLKDYLSALLREQLQD